MADGKVIIDTQLNNKGFQSGISDLKKQTGSLKSAFSGIGKIIAGAFAVGALINFGKQAIELGSNVAEVQNVVDVSFGEMAYRIEDFAKTSVQNFGMSGLAAKKTASTYMSMARGMGLSMDAAADMSLSLTGLTADVASFYNISQELADTKLRSVFTGETETLKDLGVVMTQANLEAFALKQGITKSIQAMSQAEQVQLRYAFVMDSLALAQGDFARTSDSWANQNRILSMQWQEFMSVIGQALITVFTPFLRVLNQMVSYLIQAANAFNAFVAAVFGGSAKQITSTQSAAQGVGDAIQSSVDSENDLTEATEETAKAAKGALAGFDKLNVLQKDTASGSAGGSAAAGGGVTVPALNTAEAETQTSKLADEFKKIGEAFQQYVVEPIKNGLAYFKTPIENFATLFQNVFAQIKAWAEPVTAWLQTGFRDALAAGINSVMAVAAGVLEILSVIAATMWDYWRPIIDWFVNVGLPMLSDMFIQFATIFTTYFLSVKEVFIAVWEGAVRPGLMVLSGILLDLLNLVKNLWYQYGKPISEQAKATIVNVKNTFLNAWSVVQPAFQKLFDTLDALWTNHLYPLVQKIGEFGAKWVQMGLLIYNQFILPVINWFTNVFGPPIVNVFNAIMDLVASVLAFSSTTRRMCLRCLARSSTSLCSCSKETGRALGLRLEISLMLSGTE